MLTESRDEGFRSLSKDKQNKLIKRLSDETGFNVDSLVNERVLISPGTFLSTTTSGSFTRNLPKAQNRKILSPRSEPNIIRAQDITRQSRMDVPRDIRLDITRQDLTIRTPEIPPVRLPPRDPTRPEIRPPIRPPTRPPARPSIIPEIPPEIPPRLPTLEGEPQKRKRKQQGYVASVKPVKLKGEPRQPAMDINKKPLTKELAEDAREFVLDTSLSATGKIRKVKGRPATSVQEADINFPRGYSNRNINKFRKFKQVKGKRRRLVNTVIEKRNRRLDTLGEISQIKGAGRIAQIKKKKGSAIDLINNL